MKLTLDVVGLQAEKTFEAKEEEEDIVNYLRGNFAIFIRGLLFIQLHIIVLKIYRVTLYPYITQWEIFTASFPIEVYTVQSCKLGRFS